MITQFDHQLLLFIQEYLRFDFLDGFMKAVTALGNGGVFWIGLCLLLLCFPKTRKMGVAGLLALLLGALVTNVTLKNLVARVRPYDQFSDLILLIERQRDFSFPSGHACSSFAAAGVIFKMARPRWWGVAAIVLAALIAWSRLYVAVHFPSDVIVGILIGLACSVIAVWLTQKWFSRKKETGAENVR